MGILAYILQVIKIELNNFSKEICYFETAYLTFLVKRGELTTVKILIEHGADIFQERSKNLKVVSENLMQYLTG